MNYHWQDTITETLPNEIWKELSINDEFLISSFGRIKSKNGEFRKFYRTNKGGTGNGYVITCINSQRQLVHRLVAFEFCYNTNPVGHPMVNHIDGDKANNAFWNLEWCDNRHNVRHAVKTGGFILKWRVKKTEHLPSLTAKPWR